MKLKPSFNRKQVLIAGLVIVTAVNGGGLGLVIKTRVNQPANQVAVVKTELAPTIEIKSAKQKDIGNAQQGEQIGQGTYKPEVLAKSKVVSEDKGQLAIAKHKDGARFVLALGSTAIGLETKTTEGWKIDVVANDNLWAPGACASKPTYLLQGRYIFIDDGKTSAEDKYNSYIAYDIQTGQYVYFGGNNFTDFQGTKERILHASNENDELVFYIDLTDDKGPLAGSTNFKHAKGSEHGYIVRRVIDPKTLDYKDFKITYELPTELNYYYIDPGYDSLVVFRSDGSDKSYTGNVENNRLKIALTVPNSVAISSTQDTELELALSSSLSAALPEFIKDPPYPGFGYQSRFHITELGADAKNAYLKVEDRVGGAQTPVIYNYDTKSVSPLTTTAVLSYYNYVALGVY